MEINEGHSNENTQAMYSELGIVKEPAQPFALGTDSKAGRVVGDL